MASRKPKPIEVRPISINPDAGHKPEDEDRDELENEQEEEGADQLPLEQTLEEARAEDAANGHQETNKGTEGSGVATSSRIKLKWTDAMKAATIAAIYDYRESAGAMPSILDLFEILQGDVEFEPLAGKLNHKGAPLFSPQSLQAGVNAIRKRVANDIAAEIKLNGHTDLSPLPSLARVQTTRVQRVTDSRALGLLIAQREASLKAVKDAAGDTEGDTAS